MGQLGHWPSYSITSSARCWSCNGPSRPSALAVLRLITSSNLVGCCTGRLAGCSPLSIRSTYCPYSKLRSAEKAQPRSTMELLGRRSTTTFNNGTSEMVRLYRLADPITFCVLLGRPYFAAAFSNHMAVTRSRRARNCAANDDIRHRTSAQGVAPGSLQQETP